MPLRDLCKTVFKEGTYEFAPPKDLFLLGSFLTQTQLYISSSSSDHVTSSCDLAVEMPSQLFNERDYLNYRYFIKKNMYLAHVYSQLSALKKYAQVKFEFLAECNAIYNPVLCLVFPGDDAFEVRLHAIPPSSVFRLARFNPNQANVRKDFFAKNFDSNGDLAALVSSDTPPGSDEIDDELTPMYNADILADLTARENNEFVKKTLNEGKSVIEAIKLLKLWLMKRGLNKAR